MDVTKQERRHEAAAIAILGSSGLVLVAWGGFDPVGIALAALVPVLAGVATEATRPWRRRSAIVASALLVGGTTALWIRHLSRVHGATAGFSAAVGITAGLALGVAHGRAIARLAAGGTAPGPVDARGEALGAAAFAALGAAACLRAGAEGAHLHGATTTAAIVIAAAGVAAFAAAIARRVRARMWIARAYAATDPALRVSPLFDPAPRAPRVTDRVACDHAVLRVGELARETPYRRGEEPEIVAVAPARVEDVLPPLTRRIVRDAVAFAGALAACAAVFGPLASRLHTDDPLHGARLPSAPGCEIRRVDFAPVGRVTAIDVQALADRYARVYGIATYVLPAIELDESRAFDVRRRQLVGEEVLRQAQGRARGGVQLVLVTDRDIYPRAAPWRFAFAVRDGGISLVSVARMHGPCDQLLLERAHVMITRSLLLTAAAACPAAGAAWAPQLSPDRQSVLRAQIMSVDELDQAIETVY